MWSEVWAEGSAGDGPLGAPRRAVGTTIWRFRWLVAGITAFFCLGLFGLSYLQPTRYEATIDVFLSDPRSAGVFRPERAIPIDDLAAYARYQAEFIGSASVLAGAADRLGGRLDAAELDDLVHARVSRDVTKVTIAARDATPAGAEEVAAAVYAAYAALVRDRVLSDVAASLAEVEARRVELEARLAEVEAATAANPGDSFLDTERHATVIELIALEARPRQITAAADLFGSGVLRMEPGDPPESPVQPALLRNAGIGALLGLVVALSVAWVLGQRHPSADDRRDPAVVLKAPLLGVVGRPRRGIGGVRRRTGPAEGTEEGCEVVASALEHVMVEKAASVVVITSALTGADGWRMALGVAGAVAEGGREVVLVDGDRHERGLSRDFGWDQAPGLGDCAAGAPLQDCLHRAEGIPRQLRVMPAGTPASRGPGLYHSEGFRRAVSLLREGPAWGVIAAPPVLVSAEALAIVTAADGVVLTVPRGTLLETVEDAGQRIAMTGTRMLGYVFERGRPGRRPRRGAR